MDYMEFSKLLDKLQDEFDKKRLGAEIYDDDETVWIECTKSIKPVKEILEKEGVRIVKEYESNGSDYDSYIIEITGDEPEKDLLYVITYKYKTDDIEETEEYGELQEEDAQERFNELTEDEDIEYAVLEEVVTDYIDYEDREVIDEYYAD